MFYTSERRGGKKPIVCEIKDPKTHVGREPEREKQGQSQSETSEDSQDLLESEEKEKVLMVVLVEK